MFQVVEAVSEVIDPLRESHFCFVDLSKDLMRPLDHRYRFPVVFFVREYCAPEHFDVSQDSKGPSIDLVQEFDSSIPVLDCLLFAFPVVVLLLVVFPSKHYQSRSQASKLRVQRA